MAEKLVLDCTSYSILPYCPVPISAYVEENNAEMIAARSCINIRVNKGYIDGIELPAEATRLQSCSKDSCITQIYIAFIDAN